MPIRKDISSITCRATFSDVIDWSAILIDLWEAPGWLMSVVVKSAVLSVGRSLNSGHSQGPSACRKGAMMYGPGRALQDRSSKTDERESCNNVSGL